jgi:NADH dehydrogenase FAD-containing subunit
MRRLLILGAGTAGTMVANKLRPLLAASEWEITIVDRSEEHHYQPGYLFVPFGTYRPEEIVKPRRPLIARGVEQRTGEIDRVDTEARLVHLVDGTVAALRPARHRHRHPPDAGGDPGARRAGGEGARRPQLLHPRGRGRPA